MDGQQLYPTWQRLKDHEIWGTWVSGILPKHINQAIKSFLRTDGKGSPKAVRYWLHQYRAKKNKTRMDKRVLLALEELEPDSKVLEKHIQGEKQDCCHFKGAIVKNVNTRPYYLHVGFLSIQLMLEHLRLARKVLIRSKNADKLARLENERIRKYREMNSSIMGVTDAAGNPITWSKSEVADYEYSNRAQLDTMEKFSRRVDNSVFEPLVRSYGCDRKLEMAMGRAKLVCKNTSLHHFWVKWNARMQKVLDVMTDRDARVLFVSETPLQHMNLVLFSDATRPQVKDPVNLTKDQKRMLEIQRQNRGIYV